jgi:hypothetical protein
VTTDCDVVVVGGGPAGIAAAQAAAAAGARTRLIEPARELGGNVSQAFVHTICGLYLADESLTPANPGFPLAFCAQLRRSGAAREPERVGRVWVVPIQPTAFAAAGADWLERYGTTLQRSQGTLVEAALSRDGTTPSVLRIRAGADADGAEQEVVAGAVIDASGEGILGPLGGADHDLAELGALQACSYIAVLSGVPREASAGFERMKLSVALARASREGALPLACESILLRPGGNEGEAFVTLGLPPNVGEVYDPLDPDYRVRAAAAARACFEALITHLRTQRAGFEQCALAAEPARIGVREGRRLLGSRILSGSDVLEGRTDAAEVARSSWPIELWDDHRRARFQYPAKACSVPLGALVSRSHPMLAMAGRCVSASHEALGALRVIGTALATGAAAGRAAALAVDAHCSIGDVDPARVRSAALGSEGAQP